MWRTTTSVLQFQRQGNALYGQIRSFYPAGQPADQQSRPWVADLRPIVTTDDGRIGFIETRRRRAEGAFDTSTKVGWKATLSHGLFLLIRVPAGQDKRLEVAVSADRMFNPEPDMVLDRRNEAQAQAIALGGRMFGHTAAGRVRWHRFMLAELLAEQCQVLAAWGQPLTGRSDAMSELLDQLQREALPLFEDSAFVPVFGLSYIMTTPEQRRPIYYLLQRDCPQRMKIQTGHYDPTSPWLPTSQGSFSFGAVTAGLMARREALGKNSRGERASARLAGNAGWTERAAPDRSYSAALLREAR